MEFFFFVNSIDKGGVILWFFWSNLLIEIYKNSVCINLKIFQNAPKNMMINFLLIFMDLFRYDGKIFGFYFLFLNSLQSIILYLALLHFFFSRIFVSLVMINSLSSSGKFFDPIIVLINFRYGLIFLPSIISFKIRRISPILLNTGNLL